ncbi:nuclease-related domain-containing protein [Rummeliibacillus stabekisii]|uniref:nuclease-related domain-containing protein n=1 Tax=Rummeliibacillus stabekisii TaxID=241244 RepID=UPI003713D254
METKNYQDTIYGGKDRKTWVINGEFKMRNPLFQNYGHIQAIKNNVNEKYYNNFISSVN